MVLDNVPEEIAERHLVFFNCNCDGVRAKCPNWPVRILVATNIGQTVGKLAQFFKGLRLRASIHLGRAQCQRIFRKRAKEREREGPDSQKRLHKDPKRHLRLVPQHVTSTLSHSITILHPQNYKKTVEHTAEEWTHRRRPGTVAQPESIAQCTSQVQRREAGGRAGPAACPLEKSGYPPARKLPRQPQRCERRRAAPWRCQLTPGGGARRM